jgi:hypothetical protein
MFDPDDELDDILDDNYPEYFRELEIDEFNDSHILQIMDKDGEVDNIIVGLNKIKEYIKSIENQ